MTFTKGEFICYKQLLKVEMLCCESKAMKLICDNQRFLLTQSSINKLNM